MTTLDELIVAAVERGLTADELRRLLLDYREGERVAEALSRRFPLHVQLALDLPVVAV